MAARFRMYPPSSKANKAKHQKWERKARFSGGHDASCLSLLPEGVLVEKKNEGRQRRSHAQRVGVYRAPTFGMSRQDRIAADAAYLLSAGLAQDLDEAIEKATENYQGFTAASNKLG